MKIFGDIAQTPAKASDIIAGIRKEVEARKGGRLTEFDFKDEVSLSDENSRTYSQIKSEILSTELIKEKFKALDGTPEDLNPKEGQVLIKSSDDSVEEASIENGELKSYSKINNDELHIYKEDDKQIVYRSSKKSIAGMNSIYDSTCIISQKGSGAVFDKNATTGEITGGHVWSYSYNK